jgi:outer membrane protein insertion porin family
LFGKGSPSEILISDRFFLGGPLMMRGWNSRLVGPFSQGDSIGGDLFFAGGFHLTFPFPKLSKSGVRGHLFSNVGNVSQMKSGLENLFADSRLSVGVGLIIPLMNARLEINYVLPVLKQNTDSLNRFHWGIGLEFV